MYLMTGSNIIRCSPQVSSGIWRALGTDRGSEVEHHLSERKRCHSRDPLYGCSIHPDTPVRKNGVILGCNTAIRAHFFQG